MLKLALRVARKDLLLTLGRGSGLVQGLLLGLLLLFVFSLSQGVGERMSPQGAAAVFWLSALFCQVLIFNGLYALEEVNAARLGLLLSPAPVQGIWLGKGLAGLLLLLLAQAIFLPAAVVFLGQELSGPLLPGLLALLLVDLGICALGSLLGALAQGGGSRESLLSILLFPLLIPLLLAGIRVGALCFGLDSPDGPAAARWRHDSGRLLISGTASRRPAPPRQPAHRPPRGCYRAQTTPGTCPALRSDP